MRISLVALTATVAATVGIVGFGDREDPAGHFGNVALDGVSTPAINTVREGRSQAMPVQLLAQGGISPTPAPVSGREPVVAQQTVSPVLPVAPVPAAPLPAAPEAAASGAAPAAMPAAVDESALRYFASKGDTVRLQAEIARLKALYPQWTPPADPLKIGVANDDALDRMWQLYGEGRYNEVRQAIAARQQSEAGWVVPAALESSLARADARSKIVSASEAGQYDTVVRLASGTPTLLTCNDVDMLWRVGEAFARTARPERARDAFGYILANCDNPHERVATVQKAGLVLDAASMEALLRYERPGADGQPEFASLRDDIARQIVGKGGEDATVTVPREWLERMQTLASSNRNADDALVLGWYYYRRDAIVPAGKWFAEAYDRDPQASSAQGLALTRIAQNDPGAAENTIYAFRDTSEDTRGVYLAAVANLLALEPPVPVENAVLARMASAVLETRDVAAAEQFGWYARSLGQLQTAAEWFRLALDADAGHEPAAYGLAVTLAALKDEAGVANIQRLWAGRSVRIARLHETDDNRTSPAVVTREVSEPAPVQQTVAYRPQPAAATAPAREPVRKGRTSTAGCRDTMDTGSLSAGAALARGWCLMEINRPLEAAQAFGHAVQTGSGKVREDAAYGKSLAYLRAGLTDKAAVTAASSPLDSGRAAELQTSILANRAVGAFRMGRYREVIIALDQRSRLSPERQDLMVLRGHSYKNLGYRGEARRIFQALANAGNRAGVSALADLWVEDNGG